MNIDKPVRNINIYESKNAIATIVPISKSVSALIL